MQFIGLNLTVPHKVLALEMVDELDEAARTWGAVLMPLDEYRRLTGDAVAARASLAAAATIVTSLFYPLWKMHLVAPQYSDGLDLYIFSYKIEGGGLNGQLVDLDQARGAVAAEVSA